MSKVRLVSLTQPSQELVNLGIQTPEQLIVYCARVSNPENQLNVESSDKLLKYLIKHHHWSPFEMVSMCVEIKTSRAIAAQILRHRSFSFQEFSQRYSSTSNIVDIDIRRQAEKNRQSSEDSFDPMISFSNDGNVTDETKLASDAISEHMEASLKLYSELLSSGVARECARMVLPLATESTLFMSGTIRSWIHYLGLRTDETTQLEHRIIANGIKDILDSNFPNISSAVYGQ